MRTLEQKISDAGPTNQRVDPHNLTTARKRLERSGVITVEETDRNCWYRLVDTPRHEWESHLRQIEPILDRLDNHGSLIGDTLEVTVFRALQSESEQHNMVFLGGFPGLDPSDEDTWKKSDAPVFVSGRSLSGGCRLDFIILHSVAGPVGVEVKNVRKWFYPRADEVRDFLRKCCELNAVPVMLCRRYAHIMFQLLSPCGVLIHQTYNQRLPESMSVVAEDARHKDLLGYHDIRLGTVPDRRLRTFIGDNLPSVLPEARQRFDHHRDLLWEFATRKMTYKDFISLIPSTSQLDEGQSDSLPF